jgi:hypothetical protein
MAQTALASAVSPYASAPLRSMTASTRMPPAAAVVGGVDGGAEDVEEDGGVPAEQPARAQTDRTTHHRIRPIPPSS